MAGKPGRSGRKECGPEARKVNFNTKIDPEKALGMPFSARPTRTADHCPVK